MEATQATAPAVQTPRKKESPVFQTPKKRKKWPRVLAVLLVPALAAGWFLLRGSGGDKGGAAAGYLIDTVQPRDLTVKVDGTGTVQAIQTYQVRTLVSGEVLEAPLEVGDRVEKGELLYRIDPSKAQTALQQA